MAINALFMSAIGFLSYIARDPQARSITFWSLGTLSGANWKAVTVVSISTIAGTILALRYAKQLNALMIGEEEATYLGVNVNLLERTELRRQNHAAGEILGGDLGHRDGGKFRSGTGLDLLSGTGRQKKQGQGGKAQP